MFSIDYFSPTRVILREGALAASGEVVREAGQSALVVTGKESQRKAGVLDRLCANLKAAGVAYHLAEGTSPNAKDEDVKAASKAARDHKVDVVVGLGGGSVLDCARAVAVAARLPGDYKDYFLMSKPGIAGISEAVLPIVTVPTTPGTGGEVSPAALITVDGRKDLLVSPRLFPRVAIVDPALQAGIPGPILASNGFDSFVQGLEAFLSPTAQPLSDMFAVEAMRMAYHNLPDALAHPGHVPTHARLSVAGITSSKAIAQAGVGAIHALSTPLGGRFDLLHGLALAAVIGPVLEANMGACSPRLAELPWILNGNGKSEGSAEEGVRLVLDFRDKLGLKRRLRDLGVRESSLPELSREAFTPDMATNPRKLSVDDVVAIFNQAF